MDDQGVVEHLEVDEALFPVERRQILVQILADLVVVVFARAEPPEPLGARVHLGRQLLVAEMRIPLEIDAGDRDAAPFIDVEDHADTRRIALIHKQRLGAREIVSLGVIQRIDAGPRARDVRQIEGAALGERHLVAHAVLGDARHAPDRPLGQQGPLVHVNHEHVLARRRRLRHRHRVELRARVERLNGALHVAIVDGAPRNQAADLDDADGAIALGAEHRDRIGDGRLGGDGRGARPRRPAGLCGAQTRGDSGEVACQRSTQAAHSK